jgi:hypothetical protein
MFLGKCKDNAVMPCLHAQAQEHEKLTIIPEPTITVGQTPFFSGTQWKFSDFSAENAEFFSSC